MYLNHLSYMVREEPGHCCHCVWQQFYQLSRHRRASSHDQQKNCLAEPSPNWGFPVEKKKFGTPMCSFIVKAKPLSCQNAWPWISYSPNLRSPTAFTLTNFAVCMFVVSHVIRWHDWRKMILAVPHPAVVYSLLPDLCIASEEGWSEFPQDFSRTAWQEFQSLFF